MPRSSCFVLVLVALGGVAGAQEDNKGISPYGAQAYPRKPREAAPTPTPSPAAISPYGAQAYPAAPRDPKVISPYGPEAYPYRPQTAEGSKPSVSASQQAAPSAQGGKAGRAPQAPGAYTLEAQGEWHRVPGMPASQGNPTQLAPGTYPAPPVPAGTVFKNSGIPPLTRPKSAVHPPANRFSDLYGMYPQNVVGTWVLNTGGQFTMANKGPDRSGQQEYNWGGVTGAGILEVNANGTWSWQHNGRTDTGRWADAPDTVHFMNLDGQEQFAYWNNKGRLILQGESGVTKTSLNGKP